MDYAPIKVHSPFFCDTFYFVSNNIISLLLFTNLLNASADNGWLESMARSYSCSANIEACSPSLFSNRYFTSALFAFRVSVWSAANMFGSKRYMAYPVSVDRLDGNQEEIPEARV